MDRQRCSGADKLQCQLDVGHFAPRPFWGCSRTTFGVPTGLLQEAFFVPCKGSNNEVQTGTKKAQVPGRRMDRTGIVGGTQGGSHEGSYRKVPFWLTPRPPGGPSWTPKGAQGPRATVTSDLESIPEARPPPQETLVPSQWALGTSCAKLSTDLAPFWHSFRDPRRALFRTRFRSVASVASRASFSAS